MPADWPRQARESKWAVHLDLSSGGWLLRHAPAGCCRCGVCAEEKARRAAVAAHAARRPNHLAVRPGHAAAAALAVGVHRPALHARSQAEGEALDAFRAELAGGGVAVWVCGRVAGHAARGKVFLLFFGFRRKCMSGGGNGRGAAQGLAGWPLAPSVPSRPASLGWRCQGAALRTSLSSRGGHRACRGAAVD